jgi:hypothetical protein
MAKRYHPGRQVFVFIGWINDGNALMPVGGVHRKMQN